MNLDPLDGQQQHSALSVRPAKKQKYSLTGCG